MKYKLLSILLLLIVILNITISFASQKIEIDKKYKKLLKAFEYARNSRIHLAIFGGTVRTVLLGLDIPIWDEYDILLPEEFNREHLSDKHQRFIDNLTTILGGKHKVHLIFARNYDSFKKLMAIGGLSINKMAITCDNRLLDPCRGYEDIKNRILRHIPGKKTYWKSFLPVYDVLRGIRFASNLSPLGFKLSPDTTLYYKKIMKKTLQNKKLIKAFKLLNSGNFKDLHKLFKNNKKQIELLKFQAKEIQERLLKLKYSILDEKLANFLMEKLLVNTFLKTTGFDAYYKTARIYVIPDISPAGDEIETYEDDSAYELDETDSIPEDRDIFDDIEEEIYDGPPEPIN